MSETETPAEKHARLYGPDSLAGIFERDGIDTIADQLKCLCDPAYSDLLEDYFETTVGPHARLILELYKARRNDLSQLVEIIENDIEFYRLSGRTANIDLMVNSVVSLKEIVASLAWLDGPSR